jgi:hypothetical protein
MKKIEEEKSLDTFPLIHLRGRLLANIAKETTSVTSPKKQSNLAANSNIEDILKI